MKTYTLLIFALFLFVAASPSYAQNAQQFAEKSLSYGLVVDNSGSLRTRMRQIVQASKNVVAANKPNDETFVVRFVSRDQIETSSEFTQDKASLSSAIENFKAESGQTAIIDALYVSAQYLIEKGKTGDKNRQQALILITDGSESSSFYKLEEVLKLLKDKKIAVYVIGFPNELKAGDMERAYPKAVKLLNTVSKETGGRTFIVEKKEQIVEFANGILDIIRQN